MQIKKSKKSVMSSRDAELKQTVAARADFYRRELMKCGYTKEEVKNMGIRELQDAYNNCDTDSFNSSTSTDKALKHIKAAIDILATEDSEVAKDSIANLATVMFDIKGSTKIDK